MILELCSKIEDPLDSLAINMERIMTRLDAIEMQLEVLNRHGDNPRQLLQCDHDPPYDDDAEAQFTFDDFCSRNRRNKGAGALDFNADSGGGTRFRRNKEFGPLDFNHFRGEDNGSRRGAFVGYQRRMFGRTLPCNHADEVRFM